MLNIRIRLLAGAFCTALLLSAFALLLSVSADQGQAQAVSANTHQELTLLEETEEIDALPLYILRSKDGEICVFRDEELIHRTGVAVSSLPAEDRTMLEAGIAASSEAALTALLEDLCS